MLASRLCRWVPAVMAVLLGVSHAHAASTMVRQGDMELRVAEDGHFSLSYRGIPVIRDGSFYLADANWTSTFPLSGERTYRVTAGKEGDADAARLAVVGNQPCEVTQRLVVSGSTLQYELEYEVKPGTATRYAVCDVFFNKDVLAGSTYQGKAGRTEGEVRAVQGTLEVARTGHAIAALRSAMLKTPIGEVLLGADSAMIPQGTADQGSWVLRNICDRPWGAEELRTFSLLSQVEVAQGGGIHQRLGFQVTVHPAADLDTRIAATGMERGLKALAGEAGARTFLSTLPSEPGARAGALQKELEKACREWQGKARERSAGQPLIIPQPQEMALAKGSFALGQSVRVVAPAGLAGRERTGVEILQEELRERCGVKARVSVARSSAERGAILIGEPGRNPAVAAWLKRWKVDVTAKSPGPEGYVLRVTPEVVVVAGSDPAGTFYGIQSLVQLLRPGGIPAVAIRDWPAMKWRGIHIEGQGRASAEDLRRVIRRVAAGTKMNTIIFGGSYRRFRWKSHPEITPPDKGMPIEELGDLAGYARDHFLEFIPQFQSFGHLEDLISIHPEIAEVPAGPGVHCNAYCPSNPATYALLFDLWGEVIQATRPHYFHAGHDEISHIGACARCKGRSHGELFAGDVTRLRDWLKEHGAEMMIWGDVLLNRDEWRRKGVDAANGDTSADNPGGTDTAVDLLPKDVIICDWHYAPTTEYPTVSYFMGKGLRVLGCPWYNDRNNYYFADAVHKANALGILVTDWGFLSTLTAAGTSILGAEYAWSPGKPPLDRLPYAPPRALQELLRPRRPSNALGARFAPVDLSRQAGCRASCADWSDRTSWLGQGPGADLWLLRGGRQNLEGMAFDVPADRDGSARCVLLSGAKEGGPPQAAEGIAVGEKAESLLILNALSVDEPTIWGGPVARVTVRYVDEATETFDLVEGVDVTDWRTYAARQNPWHWREGYADLYGARPALRGVTRFGEDINLQASEWVNPHPEKVIASLDVRVVRQSPRLRFAVLGITAVSLPSGSVKGR